MHEDTLHTPENAAILPSYTCIGANDRIFDHCFCLSSAATTPLTLEPMGSPALLMRTQALSSNLTTLPSGRCHFFAVRTTTACRTSPRRTLFDGHAVAGFRAEVALLLDDNYYAIACAVSANAARIFVTPHTDFGGPLRAQDVDALDDGGARVVDTVHECLNA
jgi:hypothetical protein